MVDDRVWLALLNDLQLFEVRRLLRGCRLTTPLLCLIDLTPDAAIAVREPGRLPGQAEISW